MAIKFHSALYDGHPPRTATKLWDPSVPYCPEVGYGRPARSAPRAPAASPGRVLHNFGNLEYGDEAAAEEEFRLAGLEFPSGGHMGRGGVNDGPSSAPAAIRTAGWATERDVAGWGYAERGGGEGERGGSQNGAGWWGDERWAGQNENEAPVGTFRTVGWYNDVVGGGYGDGAWEGERGGGESEDEGSEPPEQEEEDEWSRTPPTSGAPVRHG